MLFVWHLVGFGREQGIVTGPVLMALKEFPVLAEIIQRRFKKPTDRERVRNTVYLLIVCLENQ